MTAGPVSLYPVLYGRRFLLDFSTGVMPSAITFTRASSGTRFRSDTLVTETTDIPRFDFNPATLAHNGLLYEEARTNICLQSADITTTWAAVQANRTGNTSVSPDGTSNADTLTDNAVSSRHIAFQTLSSVASATYTFSAHLKAGTNNFCQLQFGRSGNVYGVVFNLTNGTITDSNTVGAGTTGISSSITQSQDSWYRCAITATITGATANAFPIIATSNSGTPAYDANGNPTYVGTLTTILVFGAVVELGATASSYIATTTGSVTRATDAATFTLPANVNNLLFTFDNGSTQSVAVSAGASYTIPTTLNRARIMKIEGS